MTASAGLRVGVGADPAAHATVLRYCRPPGTEWMLMGSLLPWEALYFSLNTTVPQCNYPSWDECQRARGEVYGVC